jgi:hypothetical protein
MEWKYEYTQLVDRTIDEYAQNALNSSGIIKQLSNRRSENINSSHQIVQVQGHRGS